MKKYIIILSLLLFVGCNKSSSSPTASDTTETETKSCTELAEEFTIYAQAKATDPTDYDLCINYLTAYQALANADCPNYPATAIASMEISCALLASGG